MTNQVDKRLVLELASRTHAYNVASAAFFDSVQDAVLFAYLVSCVPQDGGRFSVAETCIAAATGIQRRGLLDSCARLVARGLVTREDKKGGNAEAWYTVDTDLYAAEFAAWFCDDVPVEVVSPPPVVAPAKKTLTVVAPVAPAPDPALDAILDALGGGVQTFAAPVPAAKAKGKANGHAPAKRPRGGDMAAFVPLANALLEATGGDPALHMAQALQAAKKLSKSQQTPPTPEKVREVYGERSGWWYRSDWRGQKGQKPTVYQIVDTWGKWTDATSTLPPYDPGAIADAIRNFGAPGMPDLS